MANIQFEYRFQNETLEGAKLTGDLRVIKKQGRSGVNPTSIHTKIEIPEHNINALKGSVSLWFLSLEDLATAYSIPDRFSKSNPNFDCYGLLSDCKDSGNFNKSVFSLSWASRWYPQLCGKFYAGCIYDDAYKPIQRAIVSAGHVNLHKNNWYQVILTWDKENLSYKLYLNGMLTAVSDIFAKEMQWEICGNKLYAGNPTLCISDIVFYDDVLSEKEIEALYKNQATYINADVMEELKQIYFGNNYNDFHWNLKDNWVNKLDLSLINEEDLNRFYVQGNTKAPKITKDGLHVKTASFKESITPKYEIDTYQVYLWSDQVFEGDLYVEYEFNPLTHGGLSLLMTNASGMQREDFMRDYPLRINGSMSMVCWEDVRNYDWEYFREVLDTRNDIASHVIVKNPWIQPMAYRCMTESLAINKWHKLQYLQEGNSITCVIDSTVVLKVEDNPYTNNGPCFDFGRLAIRCMVDTNMLFRNLKVYNKVES